MRLQSYNLGLSSTKFSMIISEIAKYRNMLFNLQFIIINLYICHLQPVDIFWFE